MEATAAPHHSGSNEPAVPTSPVPAAPAPRATITSFFSVISPLTATGASGTTLPTSVVPPAPTTGTGTGEAPEALAAAPNAPAKGPQAPSAAPELPLTTTSTSGETILPGESHERQDNDGGALFTEPPKKGNILYGRLELKPPDLEIPEFGDASHRKRYQYPLEVKLKTIEYAQSVVEGGKGREALLA